MREQDFIERYLKEIGGNRGAPRGEGDSMPVEADPPHTEQASDYEQRHGAPYILHHLGLQVDSLIDERIAMMARVVDGHIVKSLEKEGLRDTLMSYRALLDRLTMRLPENIEMMVRGKQSYRALELMFQEIALNERSSGQTYLKKFMRNYQFQKVESLKQQLKTALATL